MLLKILKCKLFNRHTDVQVLATHLVTFVPEIGRCNSCGEVVKCKKLVPKWKRTKTNGEWNL